MNKKEKNRIGGDTDGNLGSHGDYRIIKHARPTLEVCKMLCDVPLRKKLDKFELTKFLNCHSTNLLVGAPGSGKTSLMISLFDSPDCLRSVYHNIFLFQPSHSRGSMKKNIFEELPDDQMYDELTQENMNDVLERIKEFDSSENNAIIFDDMGAYLRNNDIRKQIKELIMNRRHLHVSIFFLCQTYLSVEPDVRKLFSNLFIFKTSKKELNKIAEELIESHKDDIGEISKLVYDTPHNFLFYNTNSNKMFKNWDEIIRGTDGSSDQRP